MVEDLHGRPLKDLRISVTDRCNLRCTYCMPEAIFHKGYSFLSRKELLTYEEMLNMVQAFVALGVEKVRLTGGEPLLRRDISTFISMLRTIPQIQDLALTTNGLLLRNHARSLKEAGLHRITVSLDSLNDALLSRISGRPIQVQHVLDGIQAAEDAGFESMKINMMVQRGVNDHEIEAMADQFSHSPHEIRFIEFMDVGNTNDWSSTQVVPSKDIRNTLGRRYPIQPRNRDKASDVATRYEYHRPDGSRQKMGFISSISEPFCGDCSRARLSAIGEVFTCLFSDSGTSVRELLREGATQEELSQTIRDIWNNRSDQYSMMRNTTNPPPRRKVEMSYIGG